MNFLRRLFGWRKPAQEDVEELTHTPDDPEDDGLLRHYRLFYDVDDTTHELGEYVGTSSDAMEEAHLRMINALFNSGKLQTGPVIGDYGAEPVRPVRVAQ